MIGATNFVGRRAGYVEQMEGVNHVILRFLDAMDEDTVVSSTESHGADSLGQLKLALPSGPVPTSRNSRRPSLPIGCRRGARRPCWADQLINAMRVAHGCVVQEELPAQPVPFMHLPAGLWVPLQSKEADTRIARG